MTQPSYAHGITSTPLLGDTIGDNLRRTVGRFGDREALVSRHQRYRATYKQMWEEIGLIARGLMARGVKKGDRVALWSPNRFEWIITQYATSRIGAIMVNINPAYRSHELEHVLKQSGCSLLVMARGFRQTNYVAMFKDLEERLPEHLKAIVIDDEWAAIKEDARRVSEEELHLREQTLDPDDPIDIQYTSGTTGFPKGATLSHHNILNNGYFVGRTLKYSEKDRICVPVPLYHCFGQVMASLAAISHGACMIFPSEAFEPEAVLATVQAERCTSLYGVPTMFIAEMEHPNFAKTDFASLRTGIMAGSPCPIEVMRRVQKEMHMDEVTICYGMTETSPVSTQSKVDDPLEKRVATVGCVHPNIEIKIVDPSTSKVLPRGAVGELCTRGYSVMLGYWDDLHSTRQAIDGARWMHSGDLATMDADGYVNIVGRIKDMVMRGGENIYPREVEEFLFTKPEIADVQVIGVPDVKYGEELRSFCKGKIATYKIPRYWKFVDAFPMTVTGKIQKYKMREVAVEELKLQGAASIKTA